MAAALPLASSSGFHQRLLCSPNPWNQNNWSLFCAPPSKTHLWRLNPLPPRTIRRCSALVAEEKRIDTGVEILRLCQRGNLNEVIHSMYESKCSCFDAQVYCSVLQLCAKLGSLDDGRKVHSIISSSGVQMDSVLGQELVFMYVKCGDLTEGRKVFDELASMERPFSWNPLLTEYAKSGNHKEVISLFKQMRDASVMPNSYTFTCILKCLATLGCVREGKATHAYLIKLGFDGYNALGNALIVLYSKCKKIDDAIHLFEEMPDKDVISWNSIISGCVSNGLPGKSIQLFSEMLSLGLHVDSVTLVGVLSASTGIGCLRIGRTVHGYAVKCGFIKEEVLQNSLIDMYSKCLYLDGAVQVFVKMDKKSVVSWASMISAYTRAGHLDEAIALFKLMESTRTRPDMFVITSVLHACACNGSLEEGKYIHEFIVRNELEKNLFVANALIDMYAKCGNMLEARKVFDEMEKRDIISWNTLIGGYSKNSLPNEALNLFREMQSCLRPNPVTMSCILPAVASLSALERGKEIHAQILRSGYIIDGFVTNALVDMYVKCGALLLARLLFDRISKKDPVTWTVMIAGYGMHGHGQTAISLFKRMRHGGVEPNEVSFTVILYACSHSGLTGEGWRLFDMMRNECRIEPNLEHYTCMVELLSRAGHLTKAYKFIESMPMQPNSTVWGTLLRGCSFHRDVKLAERVAERVFELEPENTGYYILLANTYADAKKWEVVKKMRKRIGNRGLQKNPGCSWIEIKNKVHIFVTGDKSHPQSKKIELFLKDVARRMKTEGYSPKMRYALLNADDSKKEETICGHSEELAIAFGILNSSKGKPIRVAKNLRVCGGCHEIAKFISKMLKREIILRDSNRFHHFVEGRCSCRGYW